MRDSVVASKITISTSADGDGKFFIRPPSTGWYVVYAETKTANGEHMFWFEKIKIGRGKNAIKLSNSNAQSAQSLEDLLLGDLSP